MSTDITAQVQPAALNPDIDRAIKQIKARTRDYTQYQKYFDGDHRLLFVSEKFREAFGGAFQSMADNTCTAPVDAVADRLELTAFSVEEGPEAAGEDAWTIWEANRMDRRAGEVHQEALKTGDAYVTVWPDAENVPRIIPQRADMCTVSYDPEQPGVILWGAKCWTGDDNRTRLTMYYPDRIEKYITRSSTGAGITQGSDGTGYATTSATTPLDARNFIPRVVEGEAWPLPNPYDTVPLFHFANNAGVGKFGVSELRNVIPLQDALNKAVCDMLVAMEFTAFPQRWATGIEVEKDEITGESINPFKPGPGNVWLSNNESARLGDFTVGDITQYLKVQDSFRLEIARVSATPLHYMMLMTDPPSGEALKTLEARFVKKCLDRQTAFGNVWEDVMLLALKMANKPTARLQAEWVSPAPQSELELADVALQWKAAGVPDEVIWEKMGFAEADIKQWAADKAAKAAQMQASMQGAQPGQAGAPGQQMMMPMNGNRPTTMPTPAEMLTQNIRVTPPKIGG